MEQTQQHQVVVLSFIDKQDLHHNRTDLPYIPCWNEILPLSHPCMEGVRYLNNPLFSEVEYQQLHPMEQEGVLEDRPLLWEWVGVVVVVKVMVVNQRVSWQLVVAVV